MIYAHIMAGGIGRRMGNTPLPKQYLMLGSRPIIVHTIEKFLLNDKFEMIIVSVPETWISYTNEIFEKYKILDSRIHVIAGGKERNDTLEKAIQFISDANGIQLNDSIIVHDAVRPFVTKRIIDDNIKALEEYNAVDTVVPAFDTIVRGSGSVVEEIPNRSLMYQGQTPQSFNIQLFVDNYHKLSDEEKASLTDSAKIMLMSGERVAMVTGDVSNMKVTTLYDLKIARAILSEGH
ncbi:2-C-methyl-D-erythritol 4-phosphate cytidylyltransferase [Weissella paramesenteroides]|uniref:IspD/TarI family cytidylyltransferase n=1 Tax=Weissella paramesenteroides TaxID=1249 RepID=UPI00123A5920|nr:2-C-methyl-D-erythritol 4-phosphate cytidylyltransferase [Weissella paramesenteroides]KAA8442504.1 2-C-methyl-D-erythritol 4-phosphate cytidylyltransferase [Weissella paramesenteroides]KAA8442851.1 2-C-methyl-D-erythritol 4-phosphate cytidylyltransferase [Weissella paramesenteroides]KAA8444474.1 2-C-methyl-D-erythritol 4-phosphate cytidylyltransferase [Weissella paramesenteroides]KAA8448141.1 2-C-methyl-D-erythritol 4-phosphate cytidylyltransferase [Weissella paramesenteroides]KAA8452047.1 